MNFRRVGIVAALLVAVAMLGVGVASASHVKKIKSHVKITTTHPQFKGKVSSPDRACIANRTVKLYAVEPGNVVVGTDKTNSKGRWKIQFQGDGVVHYFVKVLRREDGAAGTTFVCKHDASPKTLQRSHKAAARTTVFDTKLILNPRVPAFHGRVSSDSDFCKPGRKVRLYQKKLGHGESNDKKLGTDSTNGKGRWQVKVKDLGSGAYYAKVGKLQSASLGFRCTADKSNVAVVD
jgi:hypothetical protein